MKWIIRIAFVGVILFWIVFVWGVVEVSQHIQEVGLKEIIEAIWEGDK